MNPIALYLGDTVIYWNGIMVALAVASGFFLGYSIYTAHSGRGAALWIMLPVTLALSLIISRILHCCCYPSLYDGVMTALTDFSSGGYCLQGLIAGSVLGAYIVHRTGLSGSAGEILDALSPGIAVTCGLIRLSAVFNTSCRGKISISNNAFQKLPFASPLTDASGKQDYRLATFFIEFIAFMVIAIVMLFLYYRLHSRRMKEPCRRDGNVARIFLLLFGLVEIICDSTRYDAPHLKFSSGNAIGRLLTKASGFIGLGMLIGAVIVLCVFIYYSRMSCAANGRSGKHWVLWILYFISLAGTGASEYLFQRFGWVWLYGTMGACLVLMGTTVLLMYKTCCVKRVRVYE